MAAVLFLSSSVFSAQTHLFMVGSWKESKTVCQDILYFSEPSISQIRSVKTQKHTINSDKEHRDEDLLDYTTLLKKTILFCWGGFLWPSLTYVLIQLLNNGVTEQFFVSITQLFVNPIFQRSNFTCSIQNTLLNAKKI